MSGRKDQLEYQLRKLHREKLEQELEDIRQELSRYYDNQQESSIKRRRENIYVLFALAIIGAFFSLIPRTSISINTPFLIGFGVFAIASLLFLIIKINTVALTESTTGGSKLDTYSEYIFAFSINGSIILVGIVGVINTFNINIDTIASGGLSTLAVMTSGILVPLLQKYMERQKEKRRRMKRKEKSEEIREEILEELVSEFEDLRKADARKHELEIFNELSKKIEYAKDEFVSAGQLEPLSDEIDNLEDVPDGMASVLEEKFEETTEALRDEESGEGSLEEKRQQLQEDYEEILSQAEG